MNGISLRNSTNNRELIAIVDPMLVKGPFDIEAFSEFVKGSEFSRFFLSNDNVLALAEAVDYAIEQSSMDAIEMSVGEVKDGKVSVAIASDQMSATLTITTPHNGEIPNMAQIELTLQQQGIVRGIGKRKIRNLIQLAAEAEPGQEVSDVIAKGLPPRKGKDSYVKPLVSNSFDRILAPQDAGDDKVDMRNLGDILCVKAGQSIARRMPPGKGRKGYTVTNKKLSPIAGEWKDFKLGANTEVSNSNENTVIATLAGQPKFEDGKMTIDDTFISSGVNVGTGNIKYDGAVIVNGDVTENMQVIADGDITINGFVESALIRAGGDIIITKGAMGKMQVEDCRLIASGNVFVQHGQGLDIIAGKDVNVEKQLAYSRVKCKGGVTVGTPDNPMGNLFASNINCQRAVRAGSVGAISGSVLNVDYSEGYNLLVSRSDTLNELLKSLTKTNADHEIKLSALNHRIIPASLKQKMADLNNELDSERVLLNWVKSALDELMTKRDAYELNARVIANKELFPGVTVRLNKKIYKCEKEYMKCRITLEKGNWIYDPII
jgi:uncharacterized protein (DUF342 family)